ncbi:efflux protein, MATE family [gut metagenome]|uniref:Efflux protein, MATE family n=1 Tax=gut metagenome TaxID=749906 RepID=J9CMT5_9ZZZZ
MSFNALFIFQLNLGVMGAALGTSASVICTSLFLTGWIFVKNSFLKQKAPWRFSRHSILSALRIGGPISVEQFITGTSYIAMTRIVSSLGTLSIAAHSYAITAESLCYMPAFGFASAASALIGQCIGANRIELSRQMAWRITRLTILMMSVSGAMMFILSRQLIAMLSLDPEVIEIGANLLKMEAFAEPLYGASIAIIGILRGKGDTLWPACLNLVSIWGVRITLSWILAIPYGLYGVWMAMVLELNVRGLLFIFRQRKAFPPKNATSLVEEA